MNTELKNQIASKLFDNYKLRVNEQILNNKIMFFYPDSDDEYMQYMYKTLMYDTIKNAFKPKCECINELFDVKLTQKYKKMRRFLSKIDHDIYYIDDPPIKPLIKNFIDIIAEEYYLQQLNETHKIITEYISSTDLSNHLLTYIL